MTDKLGTLSRRTVLLGVGAGTVLTLTPRLPSLAQGATKLKFITAWEILLEQMHELNAIAGKNG